jgi:hypothetical protein
MIVSNTKLQSLIPTLPTTSTARQRVAAAPESGMARRGDAGR